MGTITRNAANNFTTGGVILPAAINDASVASLTELENVAAGGAMNLISEQTASASSSIDFTSGIDSTYPIYKFEFINIHLATDNGEWGVNFTTDGTNFNVPKTTTYFYANHFESDSSTALAYTTSRDLAQGTGTQQLAADVGTDNDQSTSGYMHLFNPSSTTFVKHFISNTNYSHSADITINAYVGGYGNTTSAITGVRFSAISGNIDSGTIKLYGIKGD
jgi:hypothetical protein